MSLRDVQARIASKLGTSERYGAEPVTIHFGYYDSEGDELSVPQTLSAIVDLDSPKRRFSGGDETTVDAVISFSVDDISKSDLKGEGEVNGEPVHSVHLVIGETTYRIETIADPSCGLIVVEAINTDKKYSNDSSLDPMN